MNSRTQKGFTLLEIMIVITIISVLLGIAIPNFITSRDKARARSCVANLRQINTAKEQFAMANSLSEGATVASANLMPYLHDQTFPSCPSGGAYNIGVVGQDPTCSVGTTSNPPHVLSPATQP